MQDNYYKGKATLVERLNHAVRGIWSASQKEPNFKIELAIAVLVLALMFILPLGTVERAVLIVIITFVLALEIVNSVFERMLDLIHPRFSPEVKHIKDTLAGSVLIAALASIVIGLLILTPAFLEFDTVVSKWALNVHLQQLFVIARALTMLGSWQIILALVFVLAPWLIYKKRYEIFSFLFGSVVISEMFVFLLKMFFARERPMSSDFFEGVEVYSFPSGHALVGTAFWLTVGYIITGHSKKRKYLWFVIGAIIALIALSRIVISVHWVSDVVSGMLLGTFWFFLWFGINKRLFRGK